MNKAYNNYQSCGMPMKKDPQDGGMEANGTKSEMYCSYCYQNGVFTASEWTAEKMQEFCKDKLKEMGWPGWLAGWCTKGVPRLERWNNKR